MPDALPPLPAGTGITGLEVYPWPAEDGLHGGSPHVHLICTECYIVMSGRGRLHTLTMAGFEEHLLTPGDVVWFTPGTIHRAVNDGDLRVAVVMQNDGLPEAGDAVMTLPSEHLASAEAYARATSLLSPANDGTAEQRARERRDLAVLGFEHLVTRFRSGDSGPLREFYALAADLVTPKLEHWQRLWAAGPLAAALRTGDQIAAISRRDLGYLNEAASARLANPAEQQTGMCGLLSTYRP